MISGGLGQFRAGANNRFSARCFGAIVAIIGCGFSAALGVVLRVLVYFHHMGNEICAFDHGFDVENFG